jgi:hypothetical protein
VVLDITAIRIAVLIGRKPVSFSQDSQKNLAVIMEPVFHWVGPKSRPKH